MRIPALACSGFSILVALAACQTQDVSAPGGVVTPVPTDVAKNANLACRFGGFGSTGTFEIAVGQTRSLAETAGDCTGAYGVLSPGDGRLGFGIGPCAYFNATAVEGFKPLFKITRCLAGNGTLAIYTKSTNGTLLQNITIVAN